MLPNIYHQSKNLRGSSKYELSDGGIIYRQLLSNTANILTVQLPTTRLATINERYRKSKVSNFFKTRQVHGHVTHIIHWLVFFRY
jgi:hypothetical protein